MTGLSPCPALLAAAAGLLLAPAALADSGGAAILQELQNFRETGRVLYVAAHPDDEDTQLITFLARGRHYRTAYLSITRGDGGQNVLGPEFGPELGVIRTQELLAARRLDGGEQFFTRALDFGYSKDSQETLRIWGEQKILADVVRVVREFRPDVVIAGFSANQTPGQHGHHVASAVLADKAFRLAGDPKAFPDQLGTLQPWQPARLLQNNRFGGRNGGDPTGPLVEISGNDPVLGIPFNEIAARSRAEHKSQGFGNFGGFGGGGPRTAGFLVLDGQPAAGDIMDGIDTSWARVPGGAEIGPAADEIIAKFDPNDPSASVSALLVLRKKLAALPASPLLESKRGQLDRILQDCLGLSVVTTTPVAEAVPGEKLTLRSTAVLRSKIPVTWLASDGSPGLSIGLAPGRPVIREVETVVPPDDPPSEPYWLRRDSPVGSFEVEDSSLIGRPENPPVLPIAQRFRIGGEDGAVLAIETTPVLAGTEDRPVEARRALQIVPPVSLSFANEVRLFAPGSRREVTVEVTAARAGTKGELSLSAPAGWKIDPASEPFDLKEVGKPRALTFTVTAPEKTARAELTASATTDGRTYDNQRIEIRYPHIPGQLLQPPARIHAVSLDVATRAKKIGYIPGAGDRVADALKEMGCEVTVLDGASLTPDRLKTFDAVVIGIRAFNVRTDLAPHLPDLFAYVENGGTVVAQYNRPNDLKTDRLAPYALRLSGDRVTDETAAPTFLEPRHPALNSPNKITTADFDGWIQERGIYFPREWDARFTPLLAFNDPGESPMKGSLLVAPFGRGWFVYTGLAFFRELPAGVPGAYRLLANLVSLGK